MTSQNNWSLVRRLVGYARLERDALRALNAVYATLAEDYVNPRVRRLYDTAQTPYRRLLLLVNLPAATRRHLDTRFKAIHPIHQKTALEAARDRTLRQCRSVTFG